MISKISTLLLLLTLSACTTRSSLREEIERNDQELKVSEKALRDAINNKKQSKRKVIVIDVPSPKKETGYAETVINE